MTEQVERVDRILSLLVGVRYPEARASVTCALLVLDTINAKLEEITAGDVDLAKQKLSERLLAR